MTDKTFEGLAISLIVYFLCLLGIYLLDDYDGVNKLMLIGLYLCKILAIYYTGWFGRQAMSENEAEKNATDCRN